MTALATNIAAAQTEPSIELYKDTLPDTVRLQSFTMDRLDSTRWIEVMQAAVDEGYAGIILDSLSDEWKATLHQVDQTYTRDGRQDSRAGWRAVRPDHEGMFSFLQRLPIHVIATCRSKMQYDWESNRKRALGYEPTQDADLPYFFDCVIDMDEQTATISKVRGFDATGMQQHKPGPEWFSGYAKWLTSGEPPTTGDFAVLRLRREFPMLDYEVSIRDAIREAGVEKVADLKQPGWYERAYAICKAQVETTSAGQS
jgi:hypothetical protein